VAVACLAVDADELGLIAGVAVLQLGGILEAVGRNDAVIVVAGGHHDGRVVGAVVLDVVQGRVVAQVAEHLGAVVAAAIVGGPVPADGELVVAQHVHHAHLGHCGGK